MREIDIGVETLDVLHELVEAIEKGDHGIVEAPVVQYAREVDVA